MAFALRASLACPLVRTFTRRGLGSTAAARPQRAALAAPARRVARNGGCRSGRGGCASCWIGVWWSAAPAMRAGGAAGGAGRPPDRPRAPRPGGRRGRPRHDSTITQSPPHPCLRRHRRRRPVRLRPPADGIYAVTQPLATGGSVSMNKFKGKVILIVNVASACGFTPQYTGLAALADKYASEGLVVVAQPCNQFGGQEPGDNKAIAKFAADKGLTKGVVLAKADVNGPDASPLFSYLKDAKGGILGKDIKVRVGGEGGGRGGGGVCACAADAPPPSRLSVELPEVPGRPPGQRRGPLPVDDGARID